MGSTLLLVISLLLHGYVGLRLLPSLAGWPVAGALLGLLLATSALLLPFALIGRKLGRPGARAVVAWSGMLAMGLFSSLFVLTVLRDGLLLAWAALGALWPDALVIDVISPASAWAVLATTVMVTVLGAWNARRTAAVVRVDVPVTDLPEALHGFTIAQVSDIHVGPTIRGAYLQAIVDRVNGLAVDMVAVTGDLVDGSVAELADHVAPLAALRSRHGTFFVTGNHEYYSQPRSALAAAGLGFHLQLSDHTHGGQFWPWNLFVRLQQPFTAGLHRLRDLWIYTSRGTGYWGPPKRFGAPSEITHLRMVPS